MEFRDIDFTQHYEYCDEVITKLTVNSENSWFNMAAQNKNHRIACIFQVTDI